MSVVELPTIGFARGAVVRPKGGGPNMLVVRCLEDRTVVIVIESDEGGDLRLRDLKSSDLEQLLPANTPAT